MKNRYKVVISNRIFYKEIELPSDKTQYSIGTAINCDYRLHKELFFSDIRLNFVNSNGVWSLMCSDNIYITMGDSRRLFTKELKYGDSFTINYQDTDSEAFDVEFLIAFDSKRIRYERKIHIAGIEKITIGDGDDCNIIISGELVQNDRIELIRIANGFDVNIISSKYGIRRNGNKMLLHEKIRYGDFIAISNFSFCIRRDTIWTEVIPNCQISGLEYSDYNRLNNYPKFARNTRTKYVIDTAEIEILDPPAKPQKQKTNIIMTLLPALSMLIVSGVMAYMGGATMIIFSGVSAIMAVVTAVVGIFQGKKEYKESLIKRKEEYEKYIENKKIEIEGARQEELVKLNEIYYSMDDNIKHLTKFSGLLFDRCREDIDFLHVRLGSGNVEAKKKIQYKHQEKLEIDDELAEIPEKICKDYGEIANAPIVCNLNSANAVGIIGNDAFRYEIFKTMVIDLCARHYYRDVKLFFIAEEKNNNLFYQFRYLPYLSNDELDRRNVTCDEESRKVLFEYLYNKLTYRKVNRGYDVNFIVFLYDACGFMSHPVSKFINEANELGVTFVFFSNAREAIPQGCKYLIEGKNDSLASITDTDDISSKKYFEYVKVDDKTTSSIVKVLAPVKSEEVSLEGSLTKNITLFELLNIMGVEDLDIRSRWQNSMVYKSMSVPLGVSKTGIVYLDLHDKAHGPHGLVAGTTGSGKSEILQSYILSVATYFHPYEIAFLIIDFKGGGMVNQFKNLPHLLGAITNIDGKEINRSLKSIKAELQKRQRLFADAEVNHIDKYIKKYKNHEVSIPLPHLVIIVDEFAELKAEQPDFMKELISAARIGRSLGVHLILATQKPAGQVDDQIWSNSRFKLCLKVQGPEDSNEVLKSPLASEIKEPGRAYLQVGNNEIFELFQSAYSGAHEKDAENQIHEYKLWEIGLSGKKKLIFEQKKSKINSGGRNQLEAIVDYVNNYCLKNDIAKLPNICMQSLKDIIPFSETEFDLKNSNIEIGIYDDPDNQYQGKMFLDIDNKHTFIVGSAQYGKTNLLQLIIREIALKKNVSKANIYVLDFGSMVLKNFEKLNHVGGVICSSDDEKFRNFMKLMSEEITLRKEKLLSVGVSSYSAYSEAGYNDLPHVYVLVDNMTALMELYLQDDDTFLAIIREGLAVGISCVVVNSQTSGISYRYLSNFANKIALYNNDSNEYGNLFDHVTIKPDDKPGRCIFEFNKNLLECQTFLAFNGEKEIDRANAIKEFIEKVNQNNKGLFAKPIPYIPGVLLRSDLEGKYASTVKEYAIPIGLTYSDVEPYYLDLSQLGSIGICGKENKGHFNFISNVIWMLNENRKEYPAKVWIFDDITRKYKDLKDMDIVENYTVDTESVIDTIAAWHELLEERYQNMIMEQENNSNELLLLVIQNNDIAKKIYEDMDAMNKYIDIIDRYKGLNAGIIFANYGNTGISYDAPEPIRRIKQDRHLLYFEDLDNLKVFDVSYEDIKANKKKLQRGDAYLIDDDQVIKLKLQKSDYVG